MGTSAQAAINFLGVEWIGDETPALEQIGPLIGSLFVGAVAIFAAMLAAKTANKRQKEQLETAEREQIRALEKDQKLNNRDAFRAVATSVLSHCLDAQNAFNELSSQASNTASISEKAQDADRKADSVEKQDAVYMQMKKAAEKLHISAMEARNKFGDQQSALRETEKTVTYDNVRISVLIGADHVVTRSHWAFVFELGMGLMVLAPIAASADSDPEAITEGARQGLARALGGFRDAVLNELNEPLWDESKFTERSKGPRVGLFGRIAAWRKGH